MGRDIGIQIILAVELNHDAVKIILERGALLGCKYIENSHFFFEEPSSFVTPLEAADYIMEGVKEEERVGIEKLRTIPSVAFQYQDTFCDLIFSVWPNKGIRISYIMPNRGYWCKNDPEFGMIDWARYIQLVLALCQDFSILMLKTDDSYFESQ